MELGLHAPERDSVAHRRFDEVGQGLALLEHRLEFGSQLRLDADLGDDCGLHHNSVLRMRYTRKERPAEGKPLVSGHPRGSTLDRFRVGGLWAQSSGAGRLTPTKG